MTRDIIHHDPLLALHILILVHFLPWWLQGACIFPLNLGRPPFEAPGVTWEGVYQNQSMQGQQGIMLDIVTSQYVDCMSLLEVLSHQSKCKNMVN